MGRLSKGRKRRNVPKPMLDRKSVEDAAMMILGCVRDGMAINWHLVKAQHPEWGKEKCETYFKAAKSLAIRSMRSGI